MAKMRFLFILVLSLTCLGWSVEAGSPWRSYAQAQTAEGPSLSNLDIALWPEFDRPEVLVIYQGLFEADTPLPVAVELTIPARVGEPHAVAFFGEGGERFNQAYTTRVEGDQMVVSFDLTALGFQLEYYDQLSMDDGGERTYIFTYTADYPVQSLNLEFQVPPTAENHILEPSADSVVTEADGLVYHLVQAGPVAANETSTWAFIYQKDNEELTAPPGAAPGAAEAPVAGPSSSPGPGENGRTTIWIFLVAFVALVAVGAGAFWLGQRTEPAPGPPSPSSRASSPGRQKEKRGATGVGLQAGRGVPGTYCHRCGAQLRADSDYCHKCGTPVRPE